VASESIFDGYWLRVERLCGVAGASTGTTGCVEARFRRRLHRQHDETVSLEQATLLMQQGKNDEALALLESMLRGAGAARSAAANRIANYRKGDFLKAAANFKKALDEDPGDNEAVQVMDCLITSRDGRRKRSLP